MMTWQAKSLSWKERTHTSQRTFSDSAASTLRKALVAGLTGQLNPFVRFAHWPIIGLAAFNKTAAEAALDTLTPAFLTPTLGIWKYI